MIKKNHLETLIQGIKDKSLRAMYSNSLKLYSEIQIDSERERKYRILYEAIASYYQKQKMNNPFTILYGTVTGTAKDMAKFAQEVGEGIKKATSFFFSPAVLIILTVGIAGALIYFRVLKK